MNHSVRLIAATAAVISLTAALVGCTSGGSADVVGTWGDSEAQGQPSIQFAEDGTFGGTDGCNRLFGEYTVNGDVVEFGNMGSTMMFCEGVDTWLSEAATARVDGDLLVVSDASDSKIGTLERVAE
ncbi:META domain-containing protein [Leucobacter sp. W1153]|uniref:META domain-containing protein n=1 Tax=unclassified Leucobacter TaxID=2621730 RepID=UPI003F383FBA